MIKRTRAHRWMPRRLLAMKDVEGCEKPRGTAKQVMIRGCPNGKTRLEATPVTVH